MLLSRRIPVLIVDGESDRSMAVIHCLAQQCDIDIHVMARTRRCLSGLSRRCQTFHVWSGDDDARVEAIVDIADHIGSAVALPILEPAIAFCARNLHRLSNVLAVPHLPSPVELVDAGDKGRLASLMRRTGIPHPRTVGAGSSDVKPEAEWPAAVEEGVLSDIRFPLLLKPTSSSGGHGIEMIRNAQELGDVLDRLGDRRGGYILQEFVPGRDLGCNVLCRNGEILAYTLQRGDRQGRHSFAPCSSLDFIDHPVALDIVSSLVGTLGWSGVANIDMREDSAGNVYVLEVNPRYWSTVLGSLYAGVNFPYLQCLAALGHPFRTPTPSAVRFDCAHLTSRKSATGRSTRAGSVWRYTALDPLPEISRQLRRIRTRPLLLGDPSPDSVRAGR